MADRVLRGSRMGAVSYETDRDHDLAPRQMVKYRTEDGDIYEVPFADDAEIPEEWMCKNPSQPSRRVPTGTCCVSAVPSRNSTNCLPSASISCAPAADPLLVCSRSSRRIRARTRFLQRRTCSR